MNYKDILDEIASATVDCADINDFGYTVLYILARYRLVPQHVVKWLLVKN